MSETILSELEGLTLLALFGLGMVLAVWLKVHREQHADGFLVADREVSVWQGAFSIAVSWIWAPAIFICSLQAYTKGLPGIFWFTVPNIICFFVYTPFAVRLRNLLPEGYSLPEFIFRRYQEKRTHAAFLLVFFGYQFGAIIINSLAGGALLHTLSGVDTDVAIVFMSLTVLSYSIMSGLKASIFTDVIQMSMVLLIAFILIPWCLSHSTGLELVRGGIAGVSGEYGDVFNPWVAFSMGIPMTISLLSGPFGDQMFFQRVFAAKRENVAKTFLYGGLIFGIIPVVLSLLGFMGVSLTHQGLITVSDPQFVGPIVIAELLPRFALYLFCLMAFAGLASTMDSGLCAGTSLACVDIYKRYINPTADDKALLRFSRLFMIGMTVVGTGIALLKPKLLWVFFIYGALVSAGVFPTILSLCWKRMSAAGAFYGVILSLLIGMPLSIYANVKDEPSLIVAASVLSVGIGLVVSVIAGLLNRTSYNFDDLRK
jgi:Na+/proline symporter